MYRCFECNKDFEDCEKYPDFSGEFWGAPFTKYYYGCPYCKSEDVLEIKLHCDCCNCNIYEGDTYYELEDGSTFCEDCITKKEA